MDALHAGLAWLLKSFCVMFYIVPPSELALGEGDTAPPYLLLRGIPMFFVFIALEAAALPALRALARATGAKDGSALAAAAASRGYRLNDGICSALLGTFQQIGLMLFDIAGISLEVTFYTWVYDHCRLATIDAKATPLLAYVGLMFGKDLGYYWAHRFLHEWHFMWVGHSVHHSGEDYNLATGLRQGVWQPVVGWPFYLPLALAGFHPVAFHAHAQLNTLYMYWIHTELVGRCGPLEYVFNTPMAHRMHHRPPGNCNYAGMFIIWDRMFGTYMPERVRRDVYGLAKQPNTSVVSAQTCVCVCVRDGPGSNTPRAVL